MLLGLDLGTTNVKALATDLAGQPLAQAVCPIQLLHRPDGGVEQDIDEIWRATLEVIGQVGRAIDLTRIEAVGVSSQGGAMQILDGRGHPRGRVVSWLDQRGKLCDDALTEELGPEWFRRRIGHGRSGLAIGQLLRLRKEGGELCGGSSGVRFVGDMIVSRLGGRAAHDGTSGGLTLLYNPERRTYDPDVLRRLGLTARQLPDLISPREAAGELRADVAREIGMRPGIPVSAAIHDQYASALGAGAGRVGSVMVGTGTAWVLLAVSDRLSKPVTDDAFVCGHVIEGLFGQIISMVNGGSSLTWALDLFGLNGRSPEEMDDFLESVPAGSAGIDFWPFLAPSGATGLSPAATGRLSGLQLSHRPGHIVRAVVEGLVLELQRHLGFFRDADLSVERLIMAGGAAASRVTPQMVADVTGVPVECSSTAEASLLGAAMIARGVLEPSVSLSQLAVTMTPRARLIEPGPNAAFYQERLQRYLGAVPWLRTHQS